MIRQINLNDSLDSLKELLRSYIRTNADDPNDGMFYGVTNCTMTSGGTEYTGVRATAMIGETEVPVVDFYRLGAYDGKGLFVRLYYGGLSSYVYNVQIGINSTTSYGVPVHKLKFAYATDNGFMLMFEMIPVSSTNANVIWVTVLVTKGNDGYPFIVVPAYANVSTEEVVWHTNQVVTCHVTDDLYLSSSMLTSIVAANQNALCPFMGYGDQLSVTYAPYAYWTPLIQTSVRSQGFSFIRFNSEMDGISNGYWVIFDSTEEGIS